ncbi:unnamed protein product [Amoebophrya sp. A120]|nr:unnamed protein product [Amoebophrya sp. A120]|eukprot:GSA120T00019222001.1
MLCMTNKLSCGRGGAFPHVHKKHTCTRIFCFWGLLYFCMIIVLHFRARTGTSLSSSTSGTYLLLVLLYNDEHESES